LSSKKKLFPHFLKVKLNSDVTTDPIVQKLLGVCNARAKPFIKPTSTTYSDAEPGKRDKFLLSSFD
jgi:hypothetical protein